MRGAKLFFIGLFLFFVPFAAALPMQRLFVSFAQFTQNEFLISSLTFLLFFMLLYAIFAAGLVRIPAFQREHRLSKEGKIVALALSALATSSIFFGLGPRWFSGSLENILGPFGIFGGLALALVIFLMIFLGLRQGSEHNLLIALAAAALGMIIAGAVASHPNISSWGWIIAGIVALIAFLFALLHAFGGGAQYTSAVPSHPSPQIPQQYPQFSPASPVYRTQPAQPTTGGIRSTPAPAHRQPQPTTTAPQPQPAAHVAQLQQQKAKINELAKKLANKQLHFPTPKFFQWQNPKEQQENPQRIDYLLAVLPDVYNYFRYFLSLIEKKPSLLPEEQQSKEDIVRILTLIPSLFKDLKEIRKSYEEHTNEPAHPTTAEMNERLEELSALLEKLLRETPQPKAPKATPPQPAPRADTPPPAAHIPENVRELITKYLSYQDASLSAEQKAKALQDNLTKPRAVKYAEMLMQLFKEHGEAEILKYARTIIRQAWKVLDWLKIRPTPYCHSTSWPLWDIAKQYYYFNHPGEIEEGYTCGDPLSTEKFWEIVDRHVGWEAYQAFKTQLPFRDLVEQSGNQDILALLNRAPKPGRDTLPSKDLALLGKLLREFVEHPPKTPRFGEEGFRITDKAANQAYLHKGGWKLHLVVDPKDYVEVDKWLYSNHRGQYKLLAGGDSGEADFTVYVGSRDDAEEFAQKIDSHIGHLLGPVGRIDEMPFGMSGRIVGRFDDIGDFYEDYLKKWHAAEYADAVSQSDFLNTYSARKAKANVKGVLIAHDDVWLWFPSSAGTPNLEQRKQHVVRKMVKVLTEAYGEYFTGTAKFGHPPLF